jgi:N-acetylmuramoyl-L-alanine amidase
VRCGLACAVAVLTAAPAAGAAPPLVSAQATPAVGQAPLTVTFTATGDAATYHWDFGDGSSADGRVVDHTYAAGRWTTTLTARAADGETTTQAISVTAYGLTFAGPAIVRYARRTIYRGTLVPAERGVVVSLVGPNGSVAHARTTAKGTYVLRTRLRIPGSYAVQSERAASSPVDVRVVPKLVTRLVGSGTRGSRYVFTARLVPAAAGTITVKLMRRSDVLLDRTFERHVRLALDTRRLTTYRIRVEVVPAGLYAGTVRVVRASIVLPRLSLGSHTPAVAQLGDRLRTLHYAAPYGATFDGRMLDAVYAFQKVHGLPRTGVADARVWQALGNASTPTPRYASPGDHLEINKGRQVLYVVRRARVALIVPISTAGLPGTYTPVGRFAIYRKVAGFDPSPLGTLYDPMYFTGGYAIHGNPSVPPYPASHGCVRVPMWIAPHLYATNPYGETVYVY